MQSEENRTFDKRDAGDDEAVIEESTSRIWLAVRIVIIFAAFLAMDVLVSQGLAGSPILFFILLSLIVAQLTLICIWGTLVEGTFWVRVPWTLLLLVVSWAALVYGAYRAHNFPVGSQEVFRLGGFWFFGFAVSFVPLKIAAWLFGWRIIQTKSLNPRLNSKRYAIGDMMLGTALLAVVMSIGRFIIPGELPAWSEVLAASGIAEPQFMFAIVTFSVVSLIVKLPCIWIALATKKSKLVSTSVIWIMLSGLIGMAESSFFFVVIGSPGSAWLETYLALSLGHMAMAGAMFSVLCVLRGNGYGITRIKKGPKIEH